MSKGTFMRKTLLFCGLTAALSLSTSVLATTSDSASEGWKQIGAETCLHKGRVVKMYTLNGEMRKTQCFNLQTKVNKTGKRIFQYVSRDGTVTKQGRRLS